MPENFNSSKLDIIIPIFNEEKSIKTVVDKIHSLDFENLISSYKIIVVNDCSTDNTPQVLEDIKASNNNIEIHTHSKNKGKGAAVRTGIQESNGDIIVVQDADLELIPSDIVRMIREMQKLNIEFVNGSRYQPGIIRPLYSYRRYFFNKLFSKIASIFINVRVTDLACGYKLFTRNIYSQLKLKENRFGFEAELLIKVIRLKKTLITEIPVHYFPRNAGEGKKITNFDGLRIFWTIIKYGLFRLN